MLVTYAILHGVQVHTVFPLCRALDVFYSSTAANKKTKSYNLIELLFSICVCMMYEENLNLKMFENA